MNKREFLTQIKVKLKEFDESERTKIIEYYDELISDSTEVGLTEEEAVIKLGDIDRIIKNIKVDLIIERSSSNIEKGSTGKKTNTFKNFLLILGIGTSPVVIPLVIVFAVIFIILFIVFFSVLISFSVSAVALILSGIFTTILMIIENYDIGNVLILLGASLLSGGVLGLLSIWLFKIGQNLLNLINKFFTKSIKKKSEKEEMQVA